MGTNETPLEDQRQQALKHYEEASNAIMHWSSFVRDAIMAYDPKQNSHKHGVMQAEGREFLNTIFLGDCLEVMKDLPDSSIDFICADLPYGSTKNHWDVVIPFEQLWNQYKRLIKKDGAIALFGTGLFAYKLALSNEKMYKYEIIWHKSKCGSSFTAKHRPVQKHENILIFGKGKVVYNPQLEDGEPYYRKRKANKGDKPNNHKLGVISESETTNDGFRYPSTVQFFQQKWRRQDQLHSTQKPIELIEWLIKSYSNEGDTVLDNTAGSGTTGLACKNTGRNYILIEKDETHFETAFKRVGGNTKIHAHTSL